MITEKTTTQIIQTTPNQEHPEIDTLLTYEEQNKILAITTLITSIILLATLFM